MRVYEKIRGYIDGNGLKQASVAKKAGIPASAFNAIMNGKRALCADDLRAICLALNVSPEVFIEDGIGGAAKCRSSPLSRAEQSQHSS